jgi:CHAD domain-containing protein
LRVGTRRAGAALRVFADCLPNRARKSVRDHLGTIRRAAGDARDWDVFILGLPDAKPLKTAAGKPALDFLRGYALGERSSAQLRLVAAAEEAGPAFVEESIALPQRVHEARGPHAPATFAAQGLAHLAPALAQFTADVRADPTESAALHQLRIHGKRVRYAMEIFAGCFAAPLKDVLYPAVEALQELLGGLQDAAVGAERLEGIQQRVEKVIPDEWPRLRRGITGMVRGLKSKLPPGRKAFQAWRQEWLTLAVANPLASLRLEPAAVPPPASAPAPEGGTDTRRRRQRLDAPAT